MFYSQRPWPSDTVDTHVEVNLDQAMYVLSGGLDFVGIDDVQHGKRVAYIALQTAQAMGLDTADIQDLYHASLIHDLGVSSTETRRRLINALEWERVHSHCETGAGLLIEFRPLAHLAEVVKHHHTHWNQVSETPLSERDALLANVIFLADRVDAVRAKHTGAGQTDASAATRDVIAQHRKTLFNAEVVDSFFEVSAAEEFWSTQEPLPLEDWFEAEWAPDPTKTIGVSDIHDLGRLFAHVVDAKSPYTARHSEGVAHLSCYLASRMGLSPQQQELIDVAALLHDVGKLRVPDAILNKAGPLDPEEWQIMQRHAKDSYDLLARIDGFHSIAMWAGLHHETPRGNGYPKALGGEKLPLPARIISVADVFQALAQDRPYRAGLTPAEIMPVLEREAKKNHLDSSIVKLVADNLEGCWEAAVSAGTGGCRPSEHL